MDQFIITTAKLVPYQRRSGGHTGLATAYYHEAAPGQASQGDICAVIEVLGSSKEAPEVTNLILETFRQTYYEVSDADVTERFEDSVKAVNRELATYATHGNNAWIGKISAVIAAISGSQVQITQTGSAQAYLYRQGKDTCITQGLTGKEPHRPSKTFGNIASGRLTSGDRLLLATPALLHQMASPQLAAIISDNSASSAISKLQQFLKDSDNQERIAATISEVSTAEAAALQPQSGLPNEARLGQPEGLGETAAERVRPLLQATAKGFSGFIVWARQYYQTKLLPFTKRSSLALVRFLRKVLSNRRGRIAAAVTLGLVAFLGIYLSHSHGHNKTLEALAVQYHQAYDKDSQANAQLAGGDKLGAKSNLQAAADQLTAIAQNPKSTGLDAYLAKHNHPENDPVSVSKLRDAVSAQIDEIDGLTKVTPGQLADFGALGNAKPTLMEQVGKQFIFVDPSGGSSIYRYDLTTAKLSVVANHPKGIGKVVAIAASSAGDGVYLLTDKPSVWFYTISNSSLAEKTITGGAWPKGQAISSYAGSLYILAADDSAIYKLSPAGSGFAAPNNYPLNDRSVLANAHSMTIDGSIYLGTDKGITRIFAGVVQKSDLVFPTNLMHPRAIVSASDGKLIISTDSQSNRVGIFNFGGTLEYSRQLQIKNANTVYKAAASDEAGVLYCLVDQKFVKIKY